MWRATIFFLLGWLSVTAHLQSLHAQQSSDTTKKTSGNWAEDYLAKDPLSAKERVTIEDLRRGLADPTQRDTIIERHWDRLEGVTIEQKKDFLVEFLKGDVRSVQSQAAVELGRLGLLEEVVMTILFDFLRSDDYGLREAAIVALTHMNLRLASPPDEYWKQLIESLESQDPFVQNSAKQQLESAGHSAVPILIDAMRDARPSIRLQAAELLSRIVGVDRTSKPGAGKSEPTAPSTYDVAPTPPKGLAARDSHLVRELEAKTAQQVRVFYGTNRELVEPQRPSWFYILLFAVISLALLSGLVYLWRYSTGDKVRLTSCSSLIFTGVMCLALVWSFLAFRDSLVERWKIGSGQKFGPRRDASDKVHYGYCDVSIPPSHNVGELEEPLLGAEDEEKHVILKSTEEMEEKAFFDLVRSDIAKRELPNRSCFVFIHGFNVTFEIAARRTAQIHHDLKFDGAPIFFSWPSRGSMQHYFSDRNEIGFSQYVIKQFLIDIADRVNADRIHVIAHSMGADATCRAIAELGDRGKIFDQIILAAPDIDREVFRVQLAPRITKTANRTTLYCSRSDLALHISNTFNDAPRAGDSSRGIFVTQELDTVDASGIDTALLGHSYYGDCVPILDDVRLLFDRNLAPDERDLKPWPFIELLKYWTFNLPERSAVKVDKELTTP